MFLGKENLFRASKVKALVTVLVILVHIIAMVAARVDEVVNLAEPGKSKQSVNQPDDHDHDHTQIEILMQDVGNEQIIPATSPRYVVAFP